MFTTETQTKTAVSLTDNAIVKVREILEMQDPKPSGLRISVVGGGCSALATPWPSRTPRASWTRSTRSTD